MNARDAKGYAMLWKGIASKQWNADSLLLELLGSLRVRPG
jgi:hypothetical protein